MKYVIPDELARRSEHNLPSEFPANHLSSGLTGEQLNPSKSGVENQLLAALPEKVSVTLKQPLYESNSPIEYVYFPLDTVISQVLRMADGVSVEVATVGREGMVGLPVMLRSDRSLLCSFAQIEGNALRMSTADFIDETGRSAPIRDLLLRYTEAYLVQVAQAGACSQLHSVRQRCARWLLMTQDRVNTSEFNLTHEFLGQMLGVRRATAVNHHRRPLL